MIDVGQQVAVTTVEDSEVSRIYRGVCDAVSNIGIRVKVDTISLHGASTMGPEGTYVFPWSAVQYVRLVD